MLDSLFEHLDKTIFTPELISSLEEKFEAEVSVQAQNLAASKIAALEEASEKYKQFLDKACQDYLNQYKIKLNEQVNLYLSKIAKDFVTENSNKLDMIAEAAKGNALYKVFECATEILGKDLSEMLGNSAQSGASEQIDNLKQNIDKLHAELTESKLGRYEAMKCTALMRVARNMTLPQMQRLNTIYELSESNMSTADKCEMSTDEITRRVNEALQVIGQGSNEQTDLSESVEPSKHETSWKHLI